MCKHIRRRTEENENFVFFPFQIFFRFILGVEFDKSAATHLDASRKAHRTARTYMLNNSFRLFWFSAFFSGH